MKNTRAHWILIFLGAIDVQFLVFFLFVGCDHPKTVEDYFNEKERTPLSNSKVSSFLHCLEFQETAMCNLIHNFLNFWKILLSCSLVVDLMNMLSQRRISFFRYLYLDFSGNFKRFAL